VSNRSRSNGQLPMDRAFRRSVPAQGSDRTTTEAKRPRQGTYRTGRPPIQDQLNLRKKGVSSHPRNELITIIGLGSVAGTWITEDKALQAPPTTPLGPHMKAISFRPLRIRPRRGAAGACRTTTKVPMAAINRLSVAYPDRRGLVIPEFGS